MSNDLYDILGRLSAIEEGAVTPVSVKHGLNPQQRAADQLPALFRPRGIQVLRSKTDPTHPMAGKMVGDSVEDDRLALEEAMTDIEEDMLSKVKRDFVDYLDSLERKASRELSDRAPDRELQAKAKQEIHRDDPTEEDQVDEDPTQQELSVHTPPEPLTDPVLPEGAPVKIYAMEDGIELECWGDRDRGFEIRRGGRALPSRFRSIDDADMAVRLFQRRGNRDRSADYVEER
jgi:hypothetical protein